MFIGEDGKDVLQLDCDKDGGLTDEGKLLLAKEFEDNCYD